MTDDAPKQEDTDSLIAEFTRAMNSLLREDVNREAISQGRAVLRRITESRFKGQTEWKYRILLLQVMLGDSKMENDLPSGIGTKVLRMTGVLRLREAGANEPISVQEIFEFLKRAKIELETTKEEMGSLPSLALCALELAGRYLPKEGLETGREIVETVGDSHAMDIRMEELLWRFDKSERAAKRRNEFDA